MRTKTKRSKPTDWRGIFRAIREGTPERPLPSVSLLASQTATPFHILISTMISLRTRDDVTLAASRRLFACAPDAPTVARLPVAQVERLIYPAGFYRTKARNILAVAGKIENEYDGEVPEDIETLVSFPGVGRKTANLVLGLGFGVPSICVDTHVHRISNRAGWVGTNTPDLTEIALMNVLPKNLWIATNEILVAFGQTICTPGAPICSVCPIHAVCLRVGVTRSR